MAHSALAVAKKILEFSQKERKPITPLQMIKLVFICHGYSLAYFGTPLIKESIEAWNYGPVIPELYQAVKNYGSEPILNIDAPKETFTVDELDLIKAVYDSLKEKSGIYLSSLTHQLGTPWDITWKNGKGKNSIIDNAIIQDFYLRKIHKN